MDFVLMEILHIHVDVYQDTAEGIAKYLPGIKVSLPNEKNQSNIWVRVSGGYQLLFFPSMIFISFFLVNITGCEHKLDIGFIIDSEKDVGEKNFNKSIQFVNGVVKKLGMKHDITRPALITFSNRARIRLYLTVINIFL